MGWMAPAPDGAKMSPCVDGSRVESGRYRSCSSCRVQSCVRPVHAVCSLLALKGFAGPSPLSFKRAVTPDTLTGFGWSLAIDHLLPSLTSRASTSCASHPAVRSDRSKHWLILIFATPRHHRPGDPRHLIG